MTENMNRNPDEDQEDGGSGFLEEAADLICDILEGAFDIFTDDQRGGGNG